MWYWREGGSEGGREGGREEAREGVREGGREGRREGGREGGRDRLSLYMYIVQSLISVRVWDLIFDIKNKIPHTDFLQP